MACQGTSVYLEDDQCHSLLRMDSTLITPLVLTGCDHWSSKARPFSLWSTVKLVRPLGEESKVFTRVQGLDPCPALFTATTPRWYVVNGSNPKR